jgi:uncharacterized protein (TIGR00156 family)
MSHLKETLMRNVLRVVIPVAVMAVAGCSTYSDRPLLTSAQQVSSSEDDRAVLLRGQIVRQTSGDHYLVHDGTRDVLVEINDRVRRGQHLVPGTRVEISGEVETRMFREPKVEARSVVVLAVRDPRLDPRPELR